MICGLQWLDGATLCMQGCPKNKRAVYDVEGYNQCGYHRDTGLSRSGIPRMPDALPSEESAFDDSDWTYDAFDDADLASAGWANGTGLEDGGATFLAAGTTHNNTQANPPPFNNLGHLYIFNGWGMDVEGYDASGYSMCLNTTMDRTRVQLTLSRRFLRHQPPRP